MRSSKKIKTLIWLLSIFLLFIALFIYSVYSSIYNHDHLSLESKLLSQFIQYETDFGNLNRFNKSKELPYVLNVVPLNRKKLEENLDKSSAQLFKLLNAIKTEFPNSSQLVDQIVKTQKYNIKKIENQASLQYWQVGLLRHQLNLVFLIQKDTQH